MKIAAAQIESIVGDIKGNLEKHLEMIDLAAKQSVHLIVFPEMSITGYCKEEGSALAVQANSLEILQLIEQSKKHNLVIVVGAPIIIKEELFIGSFILLPTGATEIYTKQFLHSGEEDFYSSSFSYNPSIKIKGETISFAICADIDHEEHPKNAKEQLCSLYIPSIFFTKNGIPEAHKLLAQYSKLHSLNVLMSNYSGDVYGMKSGGRSAFWDNQGRLIGSLDSEKKGLLVVEKHGDNWIEKILKNKIYS
jgi:predicted amidohydrolase